MFSGKGPNMNSPITGNNEGMHPDDRRNLVIFIIISLVVYLSFDHFILKPKIDAMRAAQTATISDNLAPGLDGVEKIAAIRTRDQVVADGARAWRGFSI